VYPVVLILILPFAFPLGVGGDLVSIEFWGVAELMDLCSVARRTLTRGTIGWMVVLMNVAVMVVIVLRVAVGVG